MFVKGSSYTVPSVLAAFSYANELQIALSVALSAGRRAQTFFDNFDDTVTVSVKGKADVVTNADREVNEFVVSELRSAFPNDIVCAEESESQRLTFLSLLRRECQKRVWFVDPIDGTSEFASRIPQWCVMIGLCDWTDAQCLHPVLGVVYWPAEGVAYCGSKQMGASFAIYDTDPTCMTCIGVSNGKLTDIPQLLRLMVSRSHFDPRLHVLFPKQLENGDASSDSTSQAADLSFCSWLHQKGVLPRLPRWKRTPFGSLGIKAAFVARGDADLYFNFSGHPSLWDLCAPQAILEGAAAVICKLDGSVPLYDGRDSFVETLPSVRREAGAVLPHVRLRWDSSQTIEQCTSSFMIASSFLLASYVCQYFSQPSLASLHGLSMPVPVHTLLCIGSGGLVQELVRQLFCKAPLQPAIWRVVVTSRKRSPDVQSRFSDLPRWARITVEELDCAQDNASHVLYDIILKHRPTAMFIAVAPSRGATVSSAQDEIANVYSRCYAATVTTVTESLKMLTERGNFLVEQVVYISSTSVYGNFVSPDQPPITVNEDDAPVHGKEIADYAARLGVTSRILYEAEVKIASIPAEMASITTSDTFAGALQRCFEEAHDRSSAPRVTICRLGEIVTSNLGVLAAAILRKCQKSDLRSCSVDEIMTALQSVSLNPVNFSPRESVCQAIIHMLAVPLPSTSVTVVNVVSDAEHGQRRKVLFRYAQEAGLIPSSAVLNSTTEAAPPGANPVHGGNRIVSASRLYQELQIQI